MDLISNGADQTYAHGDTTDDGEESDLTWQHPSTLGLTAFVLAILSLMGASVFRGIAYTATLAPRDGGFNDGGSSGNGFLIAGAFLTAAFALLPLVLARNGLRRVVPSDGAWTSHLLRAALVLSGLSLLLHLVLAVIVMTSDAGTAGIYSVV